MHNELLRRTATWRERAEVTIHKSLSPWKMAHFGQLTPLDPSTLQLEHLSHLLWRKGGGSNMTLAKKPSVVSSYPSTRLSDRYNNSWWRQFFTVLTRTENLMSVSDEKSWPFSPGGLREEGTKIWCQGFFWASFHYRLGLNSVKSESGKKKVLFESRTGACWMKNQPTTKEHSRPIGS